MAVANFELRFPIVNPSMGVNFLPPLEGALFYDVGLAWEDGDVIRWSRQPGDDPVTVRSPLTTLGVSLRMNFFGLMLLRGDWNFPQGRDIGSYWTISFGPTY